MCQFCVQHGDGKRWYLEAGNYITDLESDLARRGYMIDFVQGFDRMRKRANVAAELLDATPALLGDRIRARTNRNQQEHHFGQPVPIEECERIFDIATSIVRVPCVCRSAAGKPESGYCLAVTANPIDDTLAEAFAGFADGPDLPALERLTKDEAVELLRRCEREGLMHSVWTFITPMIGAICNCDLESGCMAMDMTVTHDLKVMWRGEHIIDFAEETCTACGECLELCPFGAISPESGAKRPVVASEKCWGCGVCRARCKSNSLTLVERREVPAFAEAW
ncbi:MAG: 4Fe-4S binding protein [Actinomycetota bacterium]|nr:4Fe-4S binding protein [Actinomycetota bacterium]